MSLTTLPAAPPARRRWVRAAVDPKSPTPAGRELRRLRLALSLTQVELAAQLGVRSDTLSRYERGVRHVPEPTLRLARRLAGGGRRAAARPEGETL